MHTSSESRYERYETHSERRKEKDFIPCLEVVCSYMSQQFSDGVSCYRIS